MDIEVRATNFGLQDGVRQYIERRLMMSLDPFDGRVGRVEVTVTNLHGRNHVRELQCRVRAQVNHAADVMIEQIDSDLVAAIDVAASRLKRTVRRCINRRRDSAKRRAGQKPIPHAA